MTRNKKKKIPSKSSTKPYSEFNPSWSKVASDLLKYTYNLANSGNFIGVLLLLGFSFLFLIAWRVPREILGEQLSEIIFLVTTPNYICYVLGGCLTFSIFANFLQERIYRRHIKTLTEVRKTLIHGLDSGDLKPLKKHNPSGFDLDRDSKNNCSNE